MGRNLGKKWQLKKGKVYRDSQVQLKKTNVED